MTDESELIRNERRAMRGRLLYHRRGLSDLWEMANRMTDRGSPGVWARANAISDAIDSLDHALAATPVEMPTDTERDHLAKVLAVRLVIKRWRYAETGTLDALPDELLEQVIRAVETGEAPEPDPDPSTTSLRPVS